MARILVIDDEANIRLMLKMALAHVGHEVTLAADAYEGLDAFGDGSGFDLTLLDQRMPGLSGIEALQTMKQRQPSARILLITAFGTIDLAAEALENGATDFLRKPFTVEVLRGAVDAALRNEPRLPTVANAAPLPALFERAQINGFRIVSSPGIERAGDGSLSKTFGVQGFDGASRRCQVRLPAYLVELVKTHADCETVPGGDDFWQAFCGEVLANYLWQHAVVPPGGILVLEDLSRSLKHWIDAVLTRESAGAGQA